MSFRTGFSDLLIANYSVDFGENNVSRYRVYRQFNFIVQSTTFDNNPVIYKASKSLLEYGRKGRADLVYPCVDTNNGVMVSNKLNGFSGYMQMLETYKYIQNNRQHPHLIEFDWNGKL